MTTPTSGDDPSHGLDSGKIRAIVAERGRDRGGLIAVLEAVQDCYGYLSEDALRAVAAETGRSLVDLYSVATFYRAFSLKPRGKHVIFACLGTACHVRGGPRIVEELERQLGISAGQTTADGEFTLETVNCMGACALGPVVVIDGRCHSKMRKSQVRHLLEQARERVATGPSRQASTEPIPDVGCPHCNSGLIDEAAPVDGLPSIRMVASADGGQGWVRMSSSLGSGAFVAEPGIPPGRVMRLFCPHCGQDLVGEGTCPECDSPMASLTCRRGGMLRVCTRLGCRGAEYELA